MWTGILKLWEAAGGTLGTLVIAFLAYIAAAARGVSRELGDVKDRAKEDREFSARERAQLSQAITEQSKVLAEQSKVLAEHYRVLVEHSKVLDWQSKTLAEHSKTLAEHSKVLAEHSKVLAEHSRVLDRQSNALAELSKSVATLQGDVQVLLDRSDRASGGEVGTKPRNARYTIARQAVPTPRGDEEGGDDE